MSVLKILICAAAAATITQIGVERANAQDNTNIWTCWDVNSAGPEPVGDRPGHALTYNQDICRVKSGPLAGGLASGDMSWEWDGLQSKELTFRLIVRKPGATAVLRGTSGGMTMIMTDGKPTGITHTTLRLRVDDWQLGVACGQVGDLDLQRHQSDGLFD